MRIALFISSLDNDESPAFSIALSPAQRIERHLKKQGHFIAQLIFQAHKEDYFEIEEFVKVQDIDFTIAFGGAQALSLMSYHRGDWALFLSYGDISESGDDFAKLYGVKAFYSAKAIITDDLRAYQYLIKRLWPIKERIYHVRKAVLPLNSKFVNPHLHLPLPANARWFLLNRDQSEMSDSLLDLFSDWHRSDPEIYLLAPLKSHRALSSRQMAKIVNRSGVIEIKEPLPEIFLSAVQSCSAIIDPSSHPDESLATLAGLELNKAILIWQDIESSVKERMALSIHKDNFMAFQSEGNLIELCMNIDRESKSLTRTQKNYHLQDYNRECGEYRDLLLRIFKR